MQWLGCDQDEELLVEANHGNSELMLFSYSKKLPVFNIIFCWCNFQFINTTIDFSTPHSSQPLNTNNWKNVFLQGGQEPEVVFCCILVVLSKQMLPSGFIVNIRVSTVEIKWYAYTVLKWVENESSVLFLINEVHQVYLISLLFSLNPLGQIQALGFHTFSPLLY